MPEITPVTLLDSLNEWGNYVNKFKRLTPDHQAGFLHEQGFAALQDLLGHVIGWWQEGQRVVNEVRADPAFVYVEPDTDAFNAELVRKFHGLSEAEVLAHFEKTRAAMAGLIKNLPADMLENTLIRDWLFADVIEHLEEHQLPFQAQH